jgi:hypothetical protein
MDGTNPPSAPRADTPVIAAAACPGKLSDGKAKLALQNVQRAFPGTHFLSAESSCFPGLAKLQLADGKTVYSDVEGRFLILGLIFDSKTGRALDNLLEGSK